jgi:HAD superfamily hydrolase (TIGR01509 family)
MVRAVIFVLDGVLLDSEQLWNQAKEDLVNDTGGHWNQDAPRDMMGMSAPEWSAYLHDDLGVPRDVETIDREVVARMQKLYRRHLPLLPGAVQAVRTLHEHWPLGLASSSNREVIDLVLHLAGLADDFAVTVSSEEVSRGKPAPDVYLETARRLDVAPETCLAVEDSSNGLRAAAAAEMTVVALPNPHYPPDPDALALAAVTLKSLRELTPELVEGLG